MTDFKISGGDLDFEFGNMSIVDGIAETQQRLAIKYQFAYGEYFLNQAEGIDWFNLALGQKPDLARLNTILEQVALDDPGILSVTDFELTFDRASRQLNLSFVGVHVSGDTFEFTFSEFLVA